MLNQIKVLFGLGDRADYAGLMKQGALILDVRTPAEYSRGHIQGSINIPVDKLDSSLVRLKVKNVPIITCCASGSRSARAKHVLIEGGISSVHDGGSWSRLMDKIN